MKLTSVENISPATTQGTGPKPRENAVIYKAMRDNGNQPTMFLPTWLFIIIKQLDRPAKLRAIIIAEIINNNRRPALSIIVNDTNVTINCKILYTKIVKTN